MCPLTCARPSRSAPNKDVVAPSFLQGAGLELLESGDFGRIEVKNRSRRNRRDIARTVFNQGRKPVPLDIQTVSWYLLAARSSFTHYLGLYLTQNLVLYTNGTTVVTYRRCRVCHELYCEILTRFGSILQFRTNSGFYCVMHPVFSGILVFPTFP